MLNLKLVNLGLTLVNMGLALVLKVQYYCDHLAALSIVKSFINVLFHMNSTPCHLAHVHALSSWSCLVVKAITK
jgi:hypothetical protein